MEQFLNILFYKQLSSSCWCWADSTPKSLSSLTKTQFREGRVFSLGVQLAPSSLLRRRFNSSKREMLGRARVASPFPQPSSSCWCWFSCRGLEEKPCPWHRHYQISTAAWSCLVKCPISGLRSPGWPLLIGSGSLRPRQGLLLYIGTGEGGSDFCMPSSVLYH